MMTLDFIFRLVLYSHEEVSFNIIFLNVFEGIKQFHLSMCFKKDWLETPFKGDNVKAIIKTSNCENDQEYPCYPLALKFNVTLAWPLRLVIP